MNRKAITLQQAHYLILGKVQRHIQAISRRYSFCFFKKCSHILMGLAGPRCLVHTQVNLVAALVRLRLSQGLPKVSSMLECSFSLGRRLSFRQILLKAT